MLRTAGSLQPFAVSRAFPGPRRVTFMPTPGSRHAVRRHQQLAGSRGGVRASFHQAVPREFEVHVAQFVAGHVVYDDGSSSGGADPCVRAKAAATEHPPTPRPARTCRKYRPGQAAGPGVYSSYVRPQGSRAVLSQKPTGFGSLRRAGPGEIEYSPAGSSERRTAVQRCNYHATGTR